MSLDYDASDNSAKCYELAIKTLRVRHELLLAAKEAAVLIADMAKAAGVSPRGPGFDRLMAAIEAFEEFEAKNYGEDA
jgi:hypothetical protein